MSLFNNIIVPLDGSESSTHALPAAQLMATASGAKLTLVRSFEGPPDWQADASRGRLRGSLAAAEHDRIGAYLWGEKLRLENRGFRAPVEIESLEGPAHETVAQLANRNPRSLIAMSTHGRSGLERARVGSVTARIVSAVSNPSLVLRSGSFDRSIFVGSFDNIIVPLDGSAFAESATGYAGELASAFGARITLIRSITDIATHQIYGAWSCMYSSLAFGYIDPNAIAEGARLDAREYLWQVADRLSAKFPAVDVEAATIEQHAVRSVVSMAERLDNPLVVMATHGRRGWKRALLGSVADQVVRESPVPTLLVKAGNQAQPY